MCELGSCQTRIGPFCVFTEEEMLCWETCQGTHDVSEVKRAGGRRSLLSFRF